MARKETPQYLNVPIPSDLKKRLDKYHEKTGIVKRKITEIALVEYLDRQEATAV